MDQGIIYCAKNIHTGKMYIGQTIVSLEKRMSQHYIDCKIKDYKFYRSLRKSNNHFVWGIIEECDRTIINEREQYWIEYYNTFYEGYNSTFGGDGGVDPNRCISFILKSPEDKIIQETNLKEFCRKNNLDFRNIQKVLSGKMRSHKGWRLPETKTIGRGTGGELTAKEFTLLSPDGKIYKGKNIKKFCEEHNLTRSNICSILNRGKQKSHKGWTLP